MVEERYKIVQLATAEKLATRVNILIKEGWLSAGGVGWNQHHLMFFQALYKPKMEVWSMGEKE